MNTFTKFAFGMWLMCVPCLSAQQITGHFYPEKQEYLVGEPITIAFEVVNAGTETVQISDSNCPYLDDPLQVENAPPLEKLSLFGCVAQGAAGSCLSSFRDIEPGGTFQRRYLLQELDSPGTYHVRGSRMQAALSKGTHTVVADLDIHSEFDVKVRAANEGELERAYQPFLNDLVSRDFTVRSFAASAITQNAPPFTEAAILALADDRPLASDSIVGMKRLATPAARAKLLQMSDPSSPEYFRQPAITALGEIGNVDDCDAMLDIAGKSKGYTQIQAYAAAGRICREKAVPILESLELTADPQLLPGILHGLGNSSFRGAIPALINALQIKDANIRREAVTALATLTHMKSQYGVKSDDSAKQAYGQWVNWWSASRNSVLIYTPDQCIAPQLLR